jgi:toxin YoeB
MKLAFDNAAWQDLQWWLANDREIAKRIFKLLEAIVRDPYVGIGKPERLRGFDTEVLSRRITLEHRLVYTVEADLITVLACRYHY